MIAAALHPTAFSERPLPPEMFNYPLKLRKKGVFVGCLLQLAINRVGMYKTLPGLHSTIPLVNIVYVPLLVRLHTQKPSNIFPLVSNILLTFARIVLN